MAWRAAERRFNRRSLAAELCAAAAAARAASNGILLALMRRFDEYGAPSAAPDAAQRMLARKVTFEGGRNAEDTVPAVTAQCVDCRAKFVISAGEVDFMKTRGFDLPRRCKPCRERRKQTSRA